MVQTKFAFLQFMNSIFTLLQSTSEINSSQLEDLQERIDIVRHKLKYVESRPTVICIGLFEPLMLAGDWIPEVVGVAGGDNLPAEAETPLLQLNWENLLQADPEIIVLIPRGFSIEQTMLRMGSLLSQPGFAGLKAVKNNRLYIADGARYFDDHGPQIVDSIEIMAEIIHPKLFNFGYEGDAWVKFSL